MQGVRDIEAAGGLTTHSKAEQGYSDAKAFRARY